MTAQLFRIIVQIPTYIFEILSRGVHYDFSAIIEINSSRFISQYISQSILTSIIYKFFNWNILQILTFATISASLGRIWYLRHICHSSKSCRYSKSINGTFSTAWLLFGSGLTLNCFFGIHWDSEIKGFLTLKSPGLWVFCIGCIGSRAVGRGTYKIIFFWFAFFQLILSVSSIINLLCKPKLSWTSSGWPCLLLIFL